MKKWYLVVSMVILPSLVAGTEVNITVPASLNVTENQSFSFSVVYEGINISENQTVHIGTVWTVPPYIHIPNSSSNLTSNKTVEVLDYNLSVGNTSMLETNITGRFFVGSASFSKVIHLNISQDFRLSIDCEDALNTSPIGNYSAEQVQFCSTERLKSIEERSKELQDLINSISGIRVVNQTRIIEKTVPNNETELFRDVVQAVQNVSQFKIMQSVLIDLNRVRDERDDYKKRYTDLIEVNRELRGLIDTQNQRLSFLEVSSKQLNETLIHTVDASYPKGTVWFVFSSGIALLFAFMILLAHRRRAGVKSPFR